MIRFLFFFRRLRTTGILLLPSSFGAVVRPVDGGQFFFSPAGLHFRFFFFFGATDKGKTKKGASSFLSTTLASCVLPLLPAPLSREEASLSGSLDRKSTLGDKKREREIGFFVFSISAALSSLSLLLSFPVLAQTSLCPFRRLTRDPRARARSETRGRRKAEKRRSSVSSDPLRSPTVPLFSLARSFGLTSSSSSSSLPTTTNHHHHDHLVLPRKVPTRREAPGSPLRLVPNPVPAGQARRGGDAALRRQGRRRRRWSRCLRDASGC